MRTVEKVSKIQICPKSFPILSKCVLNVFWGKFFEKLLPSFPWRVESSNFWEESKKSQKSKYAQNRSQKSPNVFWTCFGANFSKDFCPVFHGGSSFRKFSKKNQKFSKFQKSRKSIPKVSKRVLNMLRGKFFQKKFLPSVPWRLETSKSWKKPKKSKYSEFALNRSQKCSNVFWTCFEVIFSKKKFLTSVPWRLETSKSWKKIEKNSIFRICPKSFPKMPKSVLGWFFWKIFMPSAPWRVEYSKIFKKCFFKIPKELKIVPKSRNFQKNQKIFKIPKIAKIVPKRIQTCFERVLAQIFRNILCPVFHGGSSFRKLSKKNKKISKFQKCPKSFPKVFKRVLNKFWGKFFENFLPSFPWKVESSKNLKKIKKFQSSKIAQKSSQKYPNAFWTCFGANFSKNFWPSFPWRVEFSKIFEKKPKIFKVPKKPKIVTKSIQTCFERILGQIFRKTFAQFSMEGRVF